MLADEIESLVRDFMEPSHRNIGFVAERLVGLVEDGHPLSDVEIALRARAAPIFLVGLPWIAEQHVGCELFHPDPGSPPGVLHYSLWIGINGPEEVERLLASTSITREMNVANLRATGFIGVSDPKPSLSSSPTIRQLVKWLLLDAPSWTARRDAILQHQALLVEGDEALRDFSRFAEQQNLKPATKILITEMIQLLKHVAHDSPQLAFQNCKGLVQDALLAFLKAATWPEAGRVYTAYENELSGDLALELLAVMKGEAKFTGTQRAIIEAHAKTLELAWEHGIEWAISDAQDKFANKEAASTAEDFLQNYLQAPDLESACRALRIAPPEVFQLDRAVVVAALRYAASDDLWRVGLLAEARKQGVDESYRQWTTLLSVGRLTDHGEALRRLAEHLETSSDCLRDQVLELMLEFQNRVGDEERQQAIAQELVDHRSAWSPPSRRPLDLANLGVVSSRRGDLNTARAAYKEARAFFNQLLTPLARAQFWLKAGIFSNDYDKDLPTALHCFRIAAEECAETNDWVSVGWVFGEISSIYRSLDRARLAEVYVVLAQRSLALAIDDQHGLVGHLGETGRRVEIGVALTEFLLGDCESTAGRAKGLLGDPSLTVEERVTVERLALACALEKGHLRKARQIVKSWSKNGKRDLALVAAATISLVKDPHADAGGAFDPAQSGDFAGVDAALTGLGWSVSSVERFLRPSTRGALARALIDMFAFVKRADPFLPIRLMGDFEADVWVTECERRSTLSAQASMRQDGAPAPLPPAAPWHEIIARYHQLGVWETPDLAVMGAILDHWSLRSRFEQAVRVNPIQPSPGRLNVYFYRIDPEGHLGGVTSCAYVPEGDLIICSLGYLDGLSLSRRDEMQEDFDKLKNDLIESGWEDPEVVARSLVDSLRARQRVLLEWVIAHEIGHAHHSVSSQHQGAAQAAEEQADSFFIDGMTHDGNVGEFLHAIYGQLSMLYWYDCEKQAKRTLSEEEKRDRSIKLKPTADASGHQLLTLRAVNLVKSILKVYPELESTDYIEEFAASISVH